LTITTYVPGLIDLQVKTTGADTVRLVDPAIQLTPTGESIAINTCPWKPFRPPRVAKTLPEEPAAKLSSAGFTKRLKSWTLISTALKLP